MSYMGKLDNSSVYTADQNYALVNNEPSYETMNNYFVNKKCPYTTGPGQAVIFPTYINPNNDGQGYEILVSNFLPTNENNNYYTISTAYPFPPLSYSPVPLVPSKKDKETYLKNTSQAQK